MKIPQIWLAEAERLIEFAKEHAKIKEEKDPNYKGNLIGKSGISNWRLDSVNRHIQYHDYKFSLELVTDLITKNYYRFEKFFGYYHPEFYRKTMIDLNKTYTKPLYKISPIKVKNVFEIFSEYIGTQDNVFGKTLLTNSEEFERICNLVSGPRHELKYSLYFFRDITNKKYLMSDHDYWYWVDESAEQECYKILGLISDDKNDNNPE